MLGDIFRMLRPRTASDPFFGRLVLMQMRRGKPSYWECEKPFAPLDKAVELFVDTFGAPPTDDQRDFFRWVETDYYRICAALQNPFRDDPWASQLMKGTFEQEFRLASFSIPLRPGPEEEWDMSFDSTSDPDHLFTATMKGLQVQRISVDG